MKLICWCDRLKCFSLQTVHTGWMTNFAVPFKCKYLIVHTLPDIKLVLFTERFIWLIKCKMTIEIHNELLLIKKYLKIIKYVSMGCNKNTWDDKSMVNKYFLHGFGGCHAEFAKTMWIEFQWQNETSHTKSICSHNHDRYNRRVYRDILVCNNVKFVNMLISIINKTYQILTRRCQNIFACNSYILCLQACL